MKRNQFILSTVTIILSLTIVIGCKKKSDYTPAIYLKGGDQTILLNSTYTDPGATAQDDEDGELTDKIEFDQSALDVNTTGTYNVVYKVTDSDGNETKASRKVTVINEADAFFTGEYEVTDSALNSNVGKEKYKATITSDTKTNNKIYFTRFYQWGSDSTWIDTTFVKGPDLTTTITTDSIVVDTIAPHWYIRALYPESGDKVAATVNYTSIYFTSIQIVDLVDSVNAHRATHKISGTGKKIEYTSTADNSFKAVLSLSYVDENVGIRTSTRVARYKKK